MQSGSFAVEMVVSMEPIDETVVHDVGVLAYTYGNDIRVGLVWDPKMQRPTSRRRAECWSLRCDDVKGFSTPRIAS